MALMVGSRVRGVMELLRVIKKKKSCLRPLMGVWCVNLRTWGLVSVDVWRE